MLNSLTYEGKTEEEVLQKALDELKCNKEDLYIKSEFVEGKLFKGSKYIYHVITKKDVEVYIKEFIKKIGALMGITIDMEITDYEGIFNITLVSDNNAILIGKDGKTLNAMQTLVRQSVKNNSGINIKINLDVSNYKLKKMKNIERLVRQIANEVKDTKLNVSLEPMNSYERRLVHTIISEYPELETESTGEGKDRHVTIKYKEN